jgi:hypothetical protein
MSGDCRIGRALGTALLHTAARAPWCPRRIDRAFQYDERGVPYAVGAARPPATTTDLLRKASGPLDVALRIWHVPSAAFNAFVPTAAAISVADVATGKKATVAPIEFSELTSRRTTAIVTVAEMAATLTDAEANPTEEDMASGREIDIDDLTDPLLRSIHCLQRFVRAYGSAVYTHATEPTYPRLPESLITATRPLWRDDVPWELAMQRLSHGNNPMRPPAPMTDEQLAQLLPNVQLMSAEDPASLYQDRMLGAERALAIDGDYTAAVLMSAVAIEALLDAILGMLLWEASGSAPHADGPTKEAATTMSKDLRPRLRNAYHPLLRGTWDLNIPGPLADWNSHVAQLRNRVVHRGYTPRPSEAERALETCSNLYEHLCTLLAKRAKQFPRTALMIVGRSRLETRNAWLSVHAFDADKARTEPAWRDNYAVWRDRVDESVVRRARS